MPQFIYSETEINHLKSRDKILGAAIDRIGFIERDVIPDVFSALVNSIVGQQISMKAWATIWTRMQDRLGGITPQTIGCASIETVQACGVSMRKASYIKGIADKVLSGELDVVALGSMSDDEVCRTLTALKGIGIWTAEMVMIFSMQRPDIFSWDDLAIHRALCRLYRHRVVTKKLFEKYRRRYSPYGTVASLYLWEIAGMENSVEYTNP
jgi:DNA-3-methyladenine glycosylase II